MPEFKQFLSAAYWRGHAVETAYVIWGLLVFIVFLAANFPYSDALSGVLEPLGVKLSYQEQRLSLPLGVELDDVRLASFAEPNALPLIESGAITLSPALGSLLMGRLGVRMSANLYKGTVNTTISRAGEAMHVSFRLNALDLAAYRALREFGASLGGRLSGRGSFILVGNETAAGMGEAELRATAFMLRFGNGLAPIAFSEAAARLALKDGSLRISHLHGSGPDGTLEVNGAIKLGRDLPGSTVNLSLKIEPTPAGRSRLGFLFALLPHPTDGGPYFLRGPLLMPSIS